MRVFELYTCRNCGSAYLRAYSNNLEEPTFLWSEPGGGFQSVTGPVPELLPLDILIEPPTLSVEPADLDLVTGRPNPAVRGDRIRQVFLRRGRLEPTNEEDAAEDTRASGNGEFTPWAYVGSAPATAGRPSRTTKQKATSRSKRL